MTTVLEIAHIVSSQEKPKPHLAGHRIRVQDIAVFHNGGWSADYIAEQLELTLGQVHAALSYYFDHQQAIDADISEDNNLARQMVHEGKARSWAELERRIEQRSH